MGDDRLMQMARAAGYSMIPPQDVCEGTDDADAASEPALESAAASYLARVRAWLPPVPPGLTTANVRGTVSNWWTHRAHA